MKADNFVIAVGGRPKFPKEVSYLTISQSIDKVVTFNIPFPNIILNGWFIVDWDRWCRIFGDPLTGPHNKCCRMCVPLPMRKN